MMKKQVIVMGILVSVLAVIGVTTAACSSISPTPDKATWSRWDFTNAPRTIVSSSIPLTVAWQFTATSSIYWTPATDQDLVLVRSEYGLQAVDRITGQEKWAYPLGRSSGEGFPIVTGSDIVVVAGMGRIQALELGSGREMWQQEMAYDKGVPGGFIILSSLAMDEERVYAGGLTGSLSQVEAYDLHTGEFLWRQGERMQRSTAEVYLVDDNLQVFSGGRFILDKRTGSTIKGPEDMAFNTRLDMIISADTIFIARRDGTLRAVDLASLKTRWSLDSTCPQDGSDFQIPTIVSNTVYAGSGCPGVYAVDLPTGNIRWTYRPNGNLRVESSVAVSDGIGYVIYSDGSLRAIDLDSGKEIGLLRTEPAQVPGVKFGAGITAANGYVYAYFGGRALFAFKAMR